MSEIIITPEWLADVGFKWHQFERQNEKHWLLWCGNVADPQRFSSVEDLGVEVAPVVSETDVWNSWLRSDLAHRYSRFLFVRTLHTRHDLIHLVEAITGQGWDPACHLYGRVMTPKQAGRERDRMGRADRRMLTANVEAGFHWRDIEKDDTQGGALPEHLDAHEQTRQED